MSLSTYSLDNNLLLLSSNSSRLAVLNPAAAYIWDYHQNNIAFNEIVLSLIEKFGLTFEQAENDVRSFYAQLEHLTYETSISTIKLPEIIDSSEEMASPLTSRPKIEDPTNYIFINFLSCRFALEIRDLSLREKFWALLKHLSFEETSQADFFLQIIEEDLAYSVFTNAEKCGNRLNTKDLLPAVFREIYVAAYSKRKSEFGFGLHAAALIRNKRCLILAGKKGSGKSTLSAFLLKRGYQFLADDAVFLKRSSTDEILLEPVPHAIAIKEGSWEPLSSWWPNISSLEIYQRPDNTTVRYLAPEARHSVSKLNIPELLIFPQFSEKGPNTLTAISRKEALITLLQDNSCTPTSETEFFVQDLLNLLKQCTCYRLSFNELNQAEKCLNELFEPPAIGNQF